MSSSISDPEIAFLSYLTPETVERPLLSGTTSPSSFKSEIAEKTWLATDGTDDISVDSHVGSQPIAITSSGSFLGTSYSFSKPRHLVRLLDYFNVDLDVPPIYLSTSQVVIGAWDIANKEPVTLSFMKDAASFRKELENRMDVDSDHILLVKKALVDATVFQTPSQSHPYKMEPIDKLIQEVDGYLSHLTRRTVYQSDVFSPTSPKSMDFNFPYVLCLETYDTTLAQFISHNSVIGISEIRSIVRDIVMGLIALHSENRIHAKLSPKTIVRVGSVWKLKDLSLSTGLGQECDSRHLDMAHSPPELAYARIHASNNADFVYLADTAFDLWSLGCVIFFCIKGSPLWNGDSYGNISLLDMKRLAQWSPQEFLDQAQLFFTSDVRGDHERAVLDLLSRLLMPTPQDRKTFFPFGVVSVNQHEFLEATALETDSLVALSEREAIATMSKGDHNRFTQLTENLSLEEMWELKRARDVLLIGRFESTSFPTPTQFVILTEKLPPADTVEPLEASQARLDQALEWIDLCQQLRSSVARSLRDGDVSAIGQFWKIVRSKLPVKDYVYLYFVDDLTGEVTRRDESDKYPLEIKNKSDIFPKLFPLMELTMRSMALYHGVAGIARMFGCPPVTISESMRAFLQPKVDELKNERFVSEYGLLADDINELNSNKEKYLKGNSIRCLSLNALVMFIQKKYGRQVHNYGGLRRMADEKGLAIWTACETSNQVKEAISIRKEERLKEEMEIWAMSQDITIKKLNSSLDEEKITRRLLKEDYDVLFEENQKTLVENKDLHSTVTELRERVNTAEEMLFKCMHKKKKRWLKIFHTKK